MAKTTSQIIEENKAKRAQEAAIAASRDAIHKKQMAQISDSTAKTKDVLEKAIFGTLDYSKRKSLQSAVADIDRSSSTKKKSPTTAREEQISLRNAPETAKQKKDRTKKAYDDYLSSDEYRNKQKENQKKANQQMSASMLLHSDQQRVPIIQGERELQLRAEKDRAEREYNESENSKVMEADKEAIIDLSNAERRQLEQYAVGRDMDDFDTLNFAQNGIQVGRAEQNAADLIAKYGKQRVDEMANTLSIVNDAKLTEQAEEAGRRHGNEHAVLASAGTVPAKLVGGIMGTMDYLMGMGRRDDRYKTLDPNALGNIAGAYSSAVRGQVGQNISGDVYDEEGNLVQDGGKLRALGEAAYQAAMAVADTSARALVGGGIGGAILSATDSFSQTMSDASRRGATPEQALALATATASIEALSEKIPLDNLISTAKGGKQAVKQIIGTALKQAGIEATTEEISLIGTMLAEAAILKDKANYKQDIFNGVLQGLSPEAAVQQANNNVMGEVVNTALVSMLSGGASSVGGSVMANMSARAESRTQSGKDGQALNKEALMQKYAKNDTQVEQAQQKQEAVDADKVTAPQVIKNAIEHQQQDDVHSDTVAAYRTADVAAIMSDPEAMQWLQERGYNGDMKKMLDDVALGRYEVQQAAEQATVVKNATTEAPEIQKQEEKVEVRTENAPESNTDTEKLWGKRDGENGWNDISGGNSVWATALAMKEVNPEYFDAYMKAAEGEHTTPLIDAVINAAEDVRQESISPMAAATVINEIYTLKGEAGLRQLYNPRNGNLYESVLNRMKAIDSKNQKVGIDLDEYGRYAEISKKRVIVTNDTESSKVPEEIVKIQNEPGKAKSKVEDAIKKIASKLGLTQKKHTSPSVEVEFTFSKNKGLKESMSKQLKYGGSYADFAKAIANMDSILNNAVMIEKHTDKYKGTVREDRHLESTSVLMGLFSDGSYMIPVQFEIKKSSQNGGQLYVTVAMTKIEADVVGRTVDKNQASSLVSASDYSISEIIEKINPEDKHFLKYVPDKMLTDQQKQAKQEALEEDFERIAGYERTDGKTREEVREQFAKYGLRPTENKQKEAQQQPVNEQPAPAQRESLQEIAKAQPVPEKQQGIQRDRINSVREQAIPVLDNDGKVVSETAGNIYTSARTPDSFTPTIKRIVEEGRVSHEVQTNEESLQKAAASIAEDGSIQNALDSIRKVAESGRTGTLDVAKAILIYDELVNSDDSTHQALAEECFVTLNQLATNTGRPLQLFSLFRKMSPEGQAKVLSREVESEIKRLQNRGTVKKDYQYQEDPDMTNLYKEAAEEFKKAKTPEAKKEAEQKMLEIQNVIYAEAAAKLPTTFKAKWDAWRYMAMLGNAKTQLRNVIGNTVMMPYTEAKRKLGAAMEAVAIRDKDQRTKAFFQDREMLEWARNDAKTENVHSALEGSAKLSDSTTKNNLDDNLKTFGSSWAGEKLNSLQKAIGGATQKGDFIFKNEEYAKSLASFLQGRGYKAADLNTEGAVPVEVLNEARNYAVDEALRATFNDSNKLSDFFASFGRMQSSNPFAKAMNLLAEGVIPFRRTPANVLARGWEYSPMGLITTISKTAMDVRKGEFSASSFIDSISANLTGSAAFVLGAALANGIGNVKLVGGGVDEDEERQGHQKFALEVTANGETYSYSIDWAAPANLPLLMGVNLMETLGNPSTENFITAAANVGINTLEPMLELSCLSGLNDFVETARYAEEGNTVSTLVLKAATSYFTQGMPALARQATQAFTENKQTTFVTSDDKTIKKGQEIVAGMGVGNLYKTDKVNAWGEKESTGAVAERAFNAFIDPGTLKKVDNSAVEQEISRLNKTQEQSVSPSYFPKVISYTDSNGTYHKDHRLTEDEYQKLAQTQGQTARAILDTMIASKNYQAMTDDQKAKAVQQVYSYARETAMNATVGTKYSENWMMSLKKGREAEQILQRTADNALSNALGKINTAWDNNYSSENTAAYSQELATAYDSYSKMTPEQKAEIKSSATGTAAKYIESREKGVSHDSFMRAAKNVNNVNGTGKNGSVRDADVRQAIAKTTGLNEKQVDTIMKAYMADYNPDDSSSDKTELKYDYIRQKMKLSPAEYAATYKASVDNSKKDDKVAAIMALGYDRKTATTLYNIYASNDKGKKLYMAFYEENA